MSATRKTRKYPLVVMIVLAMTLTWLVMTGLAANDGVTPKSSTVISAIPAAATGGSGQIEAHAVQGVVLVGYYADGGNSRQLLQMAVNNTLSGLPVEKVEPLFAAPMEKSLTAIGDGGQELSIYRLRLKAGSDASVVIRKLNNNPSVAFAEPDYLAQIILTPNDTEYASQWGLAKVKAPGAWDVTTGSPEVVIAVIDSGMDMDHPDLAGKLWTNPGEIAGNGVDDDNNGYVDDIHGWNLVDDNADLGDNTGHGTGVAGIAAAASNNSSGIAGTCWNCRIMVVKVTQAGGVANYSDIAAGIDYAAQKGAGVINLSLGGYSDSTTLKTVLAAAAETAVIVGGAGNDDDEIPFYPAAYDDYVLAVAGTNNSDTKVATSNFGSWVDLTAPGEAIVTTFDGDTYGSSSGTSLAAPFAAGLAGLLRSTHTDWSADMIRAQIAQTTENIDSLNPGYESKLGSGRLNAQQALETTPVPDLNLASLIVDGKEDGRPEPGSTVDVDIRLFNEWADAANVRGTLSSTDGDVSVVTGTADFGDIDAYQRGQNQSSFQIAVAGAAPYASELNLSLKLTADAGYSRTIPFTITMTNGIEYVNGSIIENTVWKNDKLYVIEKDIGIASDVVLTIEPGTEIRFNGYYKLQVSGTLIAIGTEDKPILFTSNNASPSSSSWNAINFTDSSEDAIVDANGEYISGSALQHTLIEYADRGIDIRLASPYIANNQLKNNSYGIYGEYGSPYIAKNTVLKSAEWGIHISYNGMPKILGNRVEDNGAGIYVGYFGVGHASVNNNLVANNDGVGIQRAIFPGASRINNNTITDNSGVGIQSDSGSANVTVDHNNITRNLPYEASLFYDSAAAEGKNITATHNYWGTTNFVLIDEKIYDFKDDINVGIIEYKPILLSPEPNAPAFLGDLSVSPADPIGIETATFDLTFSRPMDQSVDPSVNFENALNGTSHSSVENSDLAQNDIYAITIDSDSNKWFGHSSEISVLRADGSWKFYDPSNSTLLSGVLVEEIAEDTLGNIWIGDAMLHVLYVDGTWKWFDTFSLHDTFVGAVAITPDGLGNVWVGHHNGAVTLIYPDESWDRYDLNDGSVGDNDVQTIVIDGANNVWFGTQKYGVKVLGSDNSWQTFNSSNSGLANNDASDIAIDANDNKWIAHLNGGVSVLRADGSWQVYTTANSGLASDTVYTVVIDVHDNKWFATSDGVSVLQSDGSWTSDIPGVDNDNLGSAIAVDPNGDYWFGHYTTGTTVLYSRQGHPIVNSARWLNDKHWRATYEVTSLVPRGEYRVSVSGAKGTDGMAIPEDTRFGFAVDYAGEISDQTPPPPPSVIAGGVDGDASSLIASWSANDKESAITGYRYAIGSAAGATDIVNWTTTTKTSIERSGLGLVDGRQYWLAVQARNSGGLWSASGLKAFISGQPYEPPVTYLPVILSK